MNEQVFMFELYILFYQFFNVDEIKYFLKFNNYMNLVANVWIGQIKAALKCKKVKRANIPFNTQFYN